MGLEDAVLLGGAQARVQGDDLDRPGRAGPAVYDVAGAEVVDERRLGVADVALAGEEDEDVAGAGGHELVDGVEDAGDLVAVLVPGGGLGGVGPRAPGAAGAGPGAGGRGGGPGPGRSGAGRSGSGGPGGLAALAGGGAHRRVGGGQGLQLGVGQLVGRGGAGRRGRERGFASPAGEPSPGT